jgi:hypothetical protein
MASALKGDEETPTVLVERIWATHASVTSHVLETLGTSATTVPGTAVVKMITDPRTIGSTDLVADHLLRLPCESKIAIFCNPTICFWLSFPRPSPTYDAMPDEPMEDGPNPEDSEARSVFVSQLAARLTARDLGYFFEDKLGDNTVLDARIVTDRLSRRSKG